jgi:hypoxanthine phosphoribosyltransferase
MPLLKNRFGVDIIVIAAKNIIQKRIHRLKNAKHKTVTSAADILMRDLNMGNQAENNLEFEIPTWDQIYDLLLKLAKTIRKSKFEADLIVGVSRGGWIPARIMSDLLGNSNLANVTAKYYVGIAETRHEPSITQTVSVPVDGKTVLVVDDIADSGKSLKLVTLHLKNQEPSEVRIATIYYKPWSIIVPHYYGKETRRWIVFPWEQKETVRKIVKKFIGTGRTPEEAKEKLISSGLKREHMERFTKEIAEEKH